jgi:beta-galactosidase
MKLLIFQTLLLVIATMFGCANSSKSKNIEVAGVSSPVISLNGTWKFSMTPPEKYWENNVEFQNWPDIQVPGECQMQGFAIKHDQPYAYKHRFDIPADYEGKQIELNFYGVYSYARIWVNGRFVREHYGGFTKWNCNITEFVKAGETAILTIELLDRTDDISYGSGYAKHQIGGILRNVELLALPNQHFRQLYYETDLDELYVNAELKVFYELNKNIPSKVRIELLDDHSDLIEMVEKDVSSLVGEISIPVEDPEKWDAEHPNLYTVVTTLFENGREVYRVSEKIGFREVLVDGNRLLVNGNPVKLRGACRHDIHPTLGRMTTPEYDMRDVILAKECNMNFIRTSHYPPSESFLDYCDEYGIYVEDETAICFVGTHRADVYRATGASQDNDEYTPIYLTQLEEMVNNHRSHPSVIIWSIGNENVFGANFIKSYEWVKGNDATRPVIYSYPGQVPDSLRIYEILSMHYPDWRGNLNQYGITTENFKYEAMPVLFDEWAHVACYNNDELKEDPNVRNFWSQSLDSMWNYVFEADGGLGGAIWCMLDETFMLPQDLPGFKQWWGILDKNITPATYMGPCVGYGEWGIVDTWRRKKPEFWGTKKAYSPTKIYIKQINEFQPNMELIIPVHNRFDHTNFNELRICWRYANQSGEFRNINLEPHKRGEIVVPGNEWKVGERLNIKFYQNDSMLVDEYNLQLGKREIELPVCKDGNLNVLEEEGRISISGAAFSFDVNKNSGLLENVRINNDTLIKSGPYLNLRLSGEGIQSSNIAIEDDVENWKCRDFIFELNHGIATIRTEGSYSNIAVHFTIQIDESGVFNIGYEVENSIDGRIIQETGLKFITGDSFKTLAWDRNSYFTAYPEAHIGRANGEADLTIKPEMNYREKPQHTWGMDYKGFYYFGLEEESPYINIARSLKENIYNYSLRTKEGSRIELYSNGSQACRFDRISGENTLIINDQWDYSSLGWGNYMKLAKSEKEFEGEVVFVVQ